MVRLVAVAVLLASPIARAEFDPIGEDGWPKGASLASLRGLPECEAPLRGAPGAAIPCRPPIAGGGAPIAYSMDWTTGLALADGTSGGTQAWGHELLVAITRSLQLGGRYELMGTGVDDRMATTVIGHHVFGVARYRWFTDEVERSAWTLGAGVGYATQGTRHAPIARLAIGHDFGAFVTRTSALTSALELAYERSLDEVPQHHLVGSLKLGFELGIREPRDLGRAAPSNARAASIHVGVLAMPGVAFGFDASVGLGRGRITLENTVSHLFGTAADDKALRAIDGAQWSALSGPRLRGWQVAYLQAQAGVSWIAGRDGGHADALWHGELGIALGCVEAGAWFQQGFDGERTTGGMLFRVGRGSGRSLCGGGSREPRFAVEDLPPPPPPPAPPPVVAEPVVEQPVVVERRVVEPPVVVRVEPIVIELDLGAVIDVRALPIERMRDARVAIEVRGSARQLAGAELQLRQALAAAGIRVDAWARVVTPRGGLRVRLTIAPGDR